uniref:Male-enhanced antigen 1 n=1 Tax=Arion vulgaris TaxID=1028688 RepID=A0A0B7B4T2_9EUPU
MAPIPEDNQDTSPNANGDDFEHLSNPNLTIPVGSDLSDSDDSEGTIGTLNGYSLLPQEPEDDSAFNSDDENIVENIGDSTYQIPSTEVLVNDADNASSDVLAGSLLSSEEAVAPTVSTSNESHHPAFLARFPDGKLPSYMQVSKTLRDKEELLWNQQRQESNKAQESKILKAMSQFSLPAENIPDWARYLPDDQWSQQILNRIGNVSGKGKHSANTRLAPSSQSSETTPETQNSLATDGWVADFTDPTTSDTEQK